MSILVKILYMPQDLSSLNSAQKQAVTHDSGPIILIAGAGTGKTTVISQRIAYLIEQGKAKADEILAMTFTDKAAQEMVERVDRLLPLGYADLWINTFHGFCERVLKSHGLDIGLSNDFKLLDKTATWMLVRQNLDRFDLEYYRPLGNPTKFIHALLNHFSRCKDEVIYPEDYLAYAEKIQLDTDLAKDREDASQEAKRLKEIANAYHVYQQLLLDNNALDFGDLINYTIKLFKERPIILKKFREQFKYVLVDEFQDTNVVQNEIVQLIAARHRRIGGQGPIGRIGGTFFSDRLYWYEGSFRRGGHLTSLQGTRRCHYLSYHLVSVVGIDSKQGNQNYEQAQCDFHIAAQLGSSGSCSKCK